MVQSAHRSIKNLLIGLVVFLLAIGFIIFAAVANNFDQVKGLLGVSPTSSAVAGSMTSLAAAGSPTSLAGAPSPTTTTKTAADINVGDCLADDPSGNVSDVNIVSCASPHAAEVVAVLTMPDGPFPNQSTIDDYKNKCADALNAYSSTSSQDPSIQLTTLTPLSDDWSDGDHTMDCVASLSPPRTASIKG